MNARHHTQNGFTLVELAIVMTIVGLLIGGILKGQELMQNARLTATIAQVRSYSAAVTFFRDAQSALPGDLQTALTRLPGCTVANGCANGNGNGIIGVETLFYYEAVDALITFENTQFWKHLAAADLISGVETSATGPTPSWGMTHPASKLNGGFHTRYTTFPGMGHILLLRGTSDGTWSFNGEKAVMPKNAALIDRKMDDGNANAGSVYSVSFGLSNGCGQPLTAGQDSNGYAETVMRLSCDLVFRL